MLNKTGALKMQSVYTGAKYLNSIYGKKVSFDVKKVEKTAVHYTIKEKCENNWRIVKKHEDGLDCLLMNDSEDSCLVFPFGKYYITHDKIQYKERNQAIYKKNWLGSLCTIQPYINYENALRVIKHNEQYARDYYASLADDDFEF